MHYKQGAPRVPGLTRRAPRLLVKVKNKEHVTAEDHVPDVASKSQPRRPLREKPNHANVGKAIADNHNTKKQNLAKPAQVIVRHISQSPRSPATASEIIREALAKRKTKPTTPTKQPQPRVIDLDASPLSTTDEERSPIVIEKPANFNEGQRGVKRSSDSFQEKSAVKKSNSKRQKVDQSLNRNDTSLFEAKKPRKPPVGKGYNQNCKREQASNIHAPPTKRSTSIPISSSPLSSPLSSPEKSIKTPSKGLLDKLDIKIPRSSNPRSISSTAESKQPRSLFAELGISPSSSQASAVTISSDTSSQEDLKVYQDTNSIQLSNCPLCQGEVDQSLLIEWSVKHPSPTFSQQKRFCHDHKVRDAKTEWIQRGYPEIHWTIFDNRLEAYHEEIATIIHKPDTSIYRTQFESTIRTGKGRSVLNQVKEDEDALSVGYYGHKGHHAIVSFLTRHFSKKLRHLALKDQVIASRDVSGYIRMVLVPEVAVRLIQEDIGVNLTTAQDILRESAAIGALLNGSGD